MNQFTFRRPLSKLRTRLLHNWLYYLRNRSEYRQPVDVILGHTLMRLFEGGMDAVLQVISHAVRYNHIENIAPLYELECCLQRYRVRSRAHTGQYLQLICLLALAGVVHLHFLGISFVHTFLFLFWRMREINMNFRKKLELLIIGLTIASTLR